MTGTLVLILRIILALALYSFLGWALFTIWRELRQQGELLSQRQIPNLILSWQSDSQTNQRQFHLPEILIGRDPNVDCPIANETISARHARLSYHHKQWWLEDMNSTNGTYLNQMPVETPTVVVTGDELRCGKVDVLVSIQGH